jgi:hypothetical protein
VESVKFRWVVALLLVMAFSYSPNVRATQRYDFDFTCSGSFDIPYACRVLEAAGSSQALRFEVYWFVGGDEAASGALKGIEFGGTSTTDIDIGIAYGDESRVFLLGATENAPDVVGIAIVFRIGNLLAIWTSIGTAENPVEPLQPYYDQMVKDFDKARNLAERFWLLIPDAGEIPGYMRTDEVTDAAPGDEVRIWGVNAAQETEISATEAALQTIVAGMGQPTAPAPIPTALPTAAGKPNSGTTTEPGSTGTTLDITSISAKDAGTGDGSIYVYADLYNGSSEFYSFVQLTATCKDSSGSVVGTGIGFVQNLGPKQSATATIIVLAVPTCDSYNVRIDSAF